MLEKIRAYLDVRENRDKLLVAFAKFEVIGAQYS